MDLKTPIKNLKSIDTTTREGRLLFAAVLELRRLTGRPDTDEVLGFLNHKAHKIFEDDNTGGHIEQRSSGAKSQTTLRGSNGEGETGNPDLADPV